MINVLSLFDGISCARLALDKAKIPIKKYFSSEIDKNAISISQANYPDHVFLGDVRYINQSSIAEKIDLLIGGSPCQDLSKAKDGNGLNGMKSSLFFEYVRLLEELKPKYFLLENVSMKQNWKKNIDDIMGVEGIEINSNLFSAQSRPRCYWTNIAYEPFPTVISNQRILDILEKDNTCIDKYFLKSEKIPQYLIDNRDHILKNFIPNHNSGIIKLLTLPKDIHSDHERQRRVYSLEGKSPTLLARSDTTKILVSDKIRKLTPLECERLQTIRDNYTAMCSDTQRYKMIGNAFTVDTIAHFLKGIQCSIH
jgi:DNA-cytosine methyltransferase